MEIYFVTGNKNKLKEAKEILNVEIKSIDLDLPEIQALYVEEIIKEKARAAYEGIKKPVIVEDVGFYIKSWNDFPGAFIKWAVKTVGCDGICKMLEGFEDRTVVSEAGICYYDGCDFHTFIGRMRGTIALEPIGENGFGYDRIFIPENHNKTMAEMTSLEKNDISMRGIAFRELKIFLDKNK